jgi:subtilase family serine protease
MKVFCASIPKQPLAVTLVALLLTCTLAIVQQSSAQSASVAPSPLIAQPIDEAQLTVLRGNTYPSARPLFDLGTAPATLPMQRMLLVLKRSPQQEYALRTLLDNQQDKHSPNYHQWLTPEQYGKQFGPTDADMQLITGWLQSHGFQLGTPSKGRTVIEFSGSASQVQEAFHTTIHKYLVNGEQHWANSSDPSIPTALTPAVAGVLSLHNFPAQAEHKSLGAFTRNKETGKAQPVKGPQPLFTFPGQGCGVQGSPCYAVGPWDFATIYNVKPLWSASTPIDGTGQTLAIVAETDINTQDISDFHNFFGLPAPNLQVINDGPDPGIVGDETEADLDVEWSSAVAKGATIDLVVSATTDTTFGVALSAQYIVDNNLAPVMSMSYGLCELVTGTAGNQFWNQIWQQASAQGITAAVSSGDNGAAGCDDHDAAPPNPAQFGLAVTGWGETPYNVSVGGTDFFDMTDQPTYWSQGTSAAPDWESALSYIPEATWNDSCTNAVFGATPLTNCNTSDTVGSYQSAVLTAGGSGGVSNCTVNEGALSTCSGGYAKPAWQTGTGVPGDGLRDIPDVSLYAAAGSPSGSFYILCEADAVQAGATSCQVSDPNTEFFGVGGTSASTPAFAGIMALVNQEVGGRQGNANYVLYKLAASSPTAFHDVTQGTILMPCAIFDPTPDCQFSAGDTYGVETGTGYNAAAGYDLATGLGSVDANNLVTGWSTAAGLFHATQTTLGLSSLNITHGNSDTVTISVTSSSGVPTGSVSLIAATGFAPPNGTGTTGVPLQSFTLDNTGKISVPTTALPGSPNSQPYAVTAHYPGDGTFAASDSTSLMVKVSAEPSTTTLSELAFDPSGNQIPGNTFPFGSAQVFIKAVVAGSSGQGFPTGKVQFSTTTGSIPTQGMGFQSSALTPVANPVALNSQGNAALGGGIVNFDAGTYNITAQYLGDPSFSSSPVSSSVNFSIQPGFTAISGLPSSISVNPGQSGSIPLSLIASSGISAVSIACTGLPAESACAPASIATSGPNTIANGTITITTTAPSASAAIVPRKAMLQRDRHSYLFAALLGGGLPLAGIFVLATPRRRRFAALFGGMLLLALLAFVPSCGGGGGGGGTQQQQNLGTPAGSYTVTITLNASGAPSESGQFTLVVQ